MTAREVIKKLTEAGFVMNGGRGGHDKMVHPDGRYTVIYRHKGDIAVGTLKAISKQTGIKLP